MRYFFCLFGVLTGLLAFIVTPSPAAAALAVQPQEGDQGTLFTFTADGFQPDERVSFWLNPPNADPFGDESYVVTADDDGRASWTWRASENAAFGAWEMVGFGNRSRAAQVIGFTIQRPADQPERVPESGADQREGQFGATLSFSASGFAPDEQVSYWASSPNGISISGGVVEADANGAANWTWKVPDEDDANATPGIWLMVAYGNTSQSTTTIRFTIDEPAVAPAPEGPTVQPAAGGPGTTFTFTASGFESEERISYWIAAPDKQIYGGANRLDAESSRYYYATADEDGRVTWRWTAPVDAISGTWTMVGVGPDSRRSYQIPFTVGAP